MRILCFIDQLGSGGAQRQLLTLAKGFLQRGHQVRFLTYHPGGHFLPELEAANLSNACFANRGRVRRLLELRNYIRTGWQDVVLAFLEAPAFYAELAGIPFRPWGLVVGERSAHPDTGKGRRRWLRWPHRFADAVVANSHTNRLILEEALPGLRPKLSTIYNAVDLDRFHPPTAHTDASSGSALRLVVVASYQRLKNMLSLARALDLLRRDGAKDVVVDWYGETPPDAEPLREAKAFVQKHGLTSALRFHPPIVEVEGAYQRADVVGLFSEYEGLPNVICEGMACGKPIVMSDVCDARHLVLNGKNGFLCNPASPEDIANALHRMAALTSAERLQMGVLSRRRAEELFSLEVVVGQYEQILQSAAHRVPVRIAGPRPDEFCHSSGTHCGCLVRQDARASIADELR